MRKLIGRVSVINYFLGFIRTIFHHRLFRFLTVGLIGFFIDTCILYTLRHELGLIPAKIISYIISFTIAWSLNRRFTFRSQDPRRFKEWSRYALIYLATGVLHVLLFAVLIHYSNTFYQHPIIPLFITVVLMAFVNFMLSKWFAFRMLDIQEQNHY